MCSRSEISTLVLLIAFCFPSINTNAQPRPGKAIFDEVAEKAGLNFRHYNGMTGKLFLPEIMGAGAALFDYDNDGDLDVFLVQGAPLEPGSKSPNGTLPRGRLFRNDLAVGSDG